MLIHDINIYNKDDRVLQNSRKKLSTSSKYECVLDVLRIMLVSWKLAYNLWMTKYVDPLRQNWYQRWPNPPKTQSGTINIAQVWLSSWYTYNHTGELKIGIQFKNYKYLFGWDLRDGGSSEVAKGHQPSTGARRRPS